MADLIPISSYHDYCDPYVLEQYKRSTKLRALIDVCLRQCDDIEQAWFEIRGALNLEDAVGPALDYIGALVGVERVPGQTDEAYMVRILMGNNSEGLPTYEALRRALQVKLGQTEIGLYPIWPAGLYYVLYEHSEPSRPENLDDYFTSGTEVVQGTFLCCEDGEEYGLIVLEDNGQPLVIDQRWPDTEYAMVDDEGYLIVGDADNVLVGIDYLTTNESFETN